MVTRVDHIELVVQHFEEHVALFRALGFKELTRTNHIAFQVPDVEAAHRALTAHGIAIPNGPRLVPSTGRTNLNFRDPDGWRLQIVDAKRRAPDPTATH
jgi:catechol 2,3-dioxygenase-like lactoylglutathione lyase family enzyme